MADVEKCAPAPAPAATVAAAPDGTSTGGVLRRWRSQDLLDRSVSALRAAAWVFSLLAFVVMASNEHGDLMKFNLYKEYRYIVAVGVLAFTYTTLQLLRQGVRLSGGQDLQPKAGLLVDFAGDQVTAYLMMSALSAAIPITNYMREASAAMREVADYLVPDSSAAMREGADNVFTNSAAASISMAFLAFVCLALSALISGFKLAKQTYI